MSYLLLPDLLAILWMAIVLSHLRSRRSTDFLHLWTAGLGLIVIEGIARIFYVLPLPPHVHNTLHVIALDGYYLAGIAFFQSATGKLRYLRHGNPYLMMCVVPSVALISAYGAGVTVHGFYVGVALLGLAAGLAGALVFRRPPIHLFCHFVLWGPVIAAAINHENRGAAYLLLFNVFAATAIAFAVTLPRERWGRTVVIAGFAMWSLCFVTHPWIAVNEPGWIPMAAKIWDLQKFLVTFGLLIVTLEEDGAAKEYQALHDTLTSLPNRRLFRDRLEQALVHAARKGSRIVLFNIDLDNFKEVNDRWGHDAGDTLLQEISRRLGAVTRQVDTLARMGGDEFHLLIHDFLPATDQASGEAMEDVLIRSNQVMESFRGAVERTPFHFEVDGVIQVLQPALSIGSAIYPDQVRTIEELCRLADQNMYADKRRRAGTSSESGRHGGIHLAPPLPEIVTHLASNSASGARPKGNTDMRAPSTG